MQWSPWTPRQYLRGVICHARRTRRISGRRERRRSGTAAGVLTDRDIVLQIIARDVSPASVTVADVMTAKPMIATQSDDLNDLMQAMRLAGIRRVPVVDSRER